MRSHVAALTLFLVAVLPLGAAAAEAWTCWSESDGRNDSGAMQTTRCRLAGQSETYDYGRASQVPVVLRPQVGSDADGVCWYWTSRDSGWVMLGVDDDGKATLGIDPDGAAGGPLIIDVIYPVCTSEPSEAPTALLEAYELLARYDHPRPSAVVDPPVGAGVAGMDVFVAETPPSPWSASLVSPQSGLRIDVETFVDAVEVDWGDGASVTVPSSALSMLTGWPDGGFGHAYVTKTCAIPGGPRCHPTLRAYELTVSYLWIARYRVDRGPWLAIPVPATSTALEYDVDEILTITTAVG